MARRNLRSGDEHGPVPIVRQDELILLRRTGLRVDLDDFEAAADRARRTGRLRNYRLALELHTGELLPEDRYEQWCLAPRQRVEADHLALSLEFAGLLEARAELDEAIRWVGRVMALSPTDEGAQVAWLRLHALAGRRHEALQLYERLRHRLADDFGIEPSVRVQILYEEIKAGEGHEPAFTADLWERVGDLRAMAGDATGAATAFEFALGYGVPGDEVRLHRKEAEAHLMRHDAPAADAQLSAAEDGITEGPSGGERIHVLRSRALWQAEVGRLEEALQSAEMSLRLAEEHGVAEDVAAAHETLAIVLHYRGEWSDGLHQQLEHMSAREAVDPGLGPVFDMHHCIGQYHLYGDSLFEGVEDYARRTLGIATSKGAVRAEAFAWCLLGESLLLRGQWDEAEACLTRSGEIHAELGPSSGALPWQRLAELAVLRGNSDEARDHLRRATAIAAVSPMSSHLWGRIYAVAALDALERGEPGHALERVRAATRAAAGHGECPSCSALLHPIAAEAHALVGDTRSAVERAEAAALFAEGRGSSAWQAMAETAAAAVALADGDSITAEQLFRVAAGLYDSAGQPFWAARARLHGALANPEMDDHEQLIEAARDEFARLGSRRAERNAVRTLATRDSTAT